MMCAEQIIWWIIEWSVICELFDDVIFEDVWFKDYKDDLKIYKDEWFIDVQIFYGWFNMFIWCCYCCI